MSIQKAIDHYGWASSPEKTMDFFRDLKKAILEKGMAEPVIVLPDDLPPDIEARIQLSKQLGFKILRRSETTITLRAPEVFSCEAIDYPSESRPSLYLPGDPKPWKRKRK